MTHRRTFVTPRQIDGASKLVALALAAVVPTQRAITRRLDEVDGWPERGDGAGRSSSTSSVVERMALDPRRPSPLGLEHDHAELVNVYADIVEKAHRLLAIRDRYAVVVPGVPCVGGVGFEWWSRSSDRCTNWAEEGRSSGLCSACRKARDRHDKKVSAA